VYGIVGTVFSRIFGAARRTILRTGGDVISKETLDELIRRRAALAEGGGADKHEKRRAQGILSARERIACLVNPDTFQEQGAHVRHRATHFGMDAKDLPADGVIVGTGYMDDRLIAVVSQDFTVAAGTLGRAHSEKIVALMRFAKKIGVPLVTFKDSGGARIQEGVDALSGYGRVFYNNVLLSGVVPQIAVIAGPCAGGAAYSPALMDFVIMVETTAHMFITGPEIIRTVTGRETTMDEIGSAQVHAAVSGNVHLVASDDRDAARLVRRLLSYLPSNNTEEPPHRPHADLTLEDDPAFEGVLPDDHATPFDVRDVIDLTVDADSFFEIQGRWAANLVIGFARIEGVVVGIVANQPMQKAGALDIDASDKGSRFIRFCNIFNIPLLTLVDVPGFLPGVEQERGGIIRHGAKMIYAYASATVPKITLILRKAYGGSYLAMCAQEMGADFVFAWPTAEIAVMGAEGAVNLLYRKDLKQAQDPAARAEALAAAYRAEFASPYVAAGHGYITDIIQPAETRWTVALALRKALTKRELRPPKKHGNSPV
jgi:acetyl-CoA carboxylase carboxyltransferase component